MGARADLTGYRVSKVVQGKDGVSEIWGTVRVLSYGLWKVDWDDGSVSSHHRNELTVRR